MLPLERSAVFNAEGTTQIDEIPLCKKNPFIAFDPKYNKKNRIYVS